MGNDIVLAMLKAAVLIVWILLYLTILLAAPPVAFLFTVFACVAFLFYEANS